MNLGLGSQSQTTPDRIFFPVDFEFFHAWTHRIRSTHRMTTIFYSTYSPMSEEHFPYQQHGRMSSRKIFRAV